jgi:hypothetical protein
LSDGFDARRASGHIAEILAIFAALVIPVLFIAASPEFKSAISLIPQVHGSHWLLVAILLLCAAFIGLAAASIGLLGLAGDATRKSAQVPSTMILFAEATCGFIGLLSAAELYGSSLGSHYVERVLICLVAGVAALGCMIVASLLVESWTALSWRERNAWIHDGAHGTLHFFLITFIALALLVGVTSWKIVDRVSPGGSYPVWIAIVLTAFAGALLPLSIVRSLPRRKIWTGPVHGFEAYICGLLPAAVAAVLIIGLPFD